MSNCQGCGTVLDPTLEEANQAVNDVLAASLKDAKKHGEICPLCGHSQAQPISHRKSILFAMLAALLFLAIGIAIADYRYLATQRQSAAQDVLKQVQSNSQVTQLLGSPLSMQGPVTGAVKQDETGWQEVHMNIPIHGPKGNATVQVAGGRESGPWKFTTLDVLMPQLEKKADLISGTIVAYSPDAYVDTHTEAAGIPEEILVNVPAPSWDGNFPCVYASAIATASPQQGSCVTPVPMSMASRTSVDRFETDLRTGKFILRQTDLSIKEAGFDIPLTRTYDSEDWMHGNKSHAFGLDSNHPYDIAPVGTRNPYTEQFIVLEDGDFLYFPRVSKGSGYSDAIYRQSEVGNSFYKATQRWDGKGWITQLNDGSTIHFPESYSARNMAQGAPTEMTDATGHKIELIRSPERNLQEIRGPDGASIKLTYDPNDRVVRAEDAHGAWTNYTYGPLGFLTDVDHSDGSARYYEYENGQLTFVRDQRQRVLVHNTYDYQTHYLIQQEYGNGQSIRYRYVMSNNGKYSETTVVFMPDGTVNRIQNADSVSDIYKRNH